MGVIIDSSVVIAAERRRESPARLGELIERAVGNQESAFSAVGLTEIVHGIYRAPTAEIQKLRDSFLQELLVGFAVYP